MAAAGSMNVGNSALVAAVTALVASLVGAAGLWFREWNARRSAEARRQRELDEARAHLGFLTEWFGAYEAVAPGTDIAPVRAWAADHLQSQLAVLRASRADEQVADGLSFLDRFRVVLLWFPLHSRSGSLVRVFFFFVLLFMGYVLGIAVLAQGDVLGTIVIVLLLIGTGIALLYGLWTLTVRLAHRTADPRLLRAARSPRAERAPERVDWTSGPGRSPP
ncbi:hypothetical protein ACFXAF_14725 [Kitasatospora sp. NPDC059463]|uniref:hypothetical protein n=1 Tax=unclassified Kitasatospora TaxID=2633591 RepID=UPI00368042E8